MINLAQIGCGYWGPNLLRNFVRLKNVSVKTVAEIDQDRIDYVHSNYPRIETIKEYKRILDDKKIDAVIIATEAISHFILAKQVLESGKHVFVEKPLSKTAKEVYELIKIAENKDKILMVGHTFEYNSAVEYLKNYINEGNLGKIYYIYSQRSNLGRVRRDVNVMWNLAPHDISILLYLLQKRPVSVSAIGASYIQNRIEDVVYMFIIFENGITAHIHLSWLDPCKVRKMTVVGSKKMILYDDVADDKIQIYDRGIDRKNISVDLGSYNSFGKFQLMRRAGDILSPKINFIEPLKTECEHFIDCILEKEEPLTDGYDGLRVVTLLEAAQKSLDRDGEKVNLEKL